MRPLRFTLGHSNRTKEDRHVSTPSGSDRFTTLPDDQTLASAVVTLAIAAYGQTSSVGKVFEIHQELPGRIRIVIIRQVVGF
jgi:hypothetical protein